VALRRAAADTMGERGAQEEEEQVVQLQEERRRMFKGAGVPFI